MQELTNNYYHKLQRTDLNIRLEEEESEKEEVPEEPSLPSLPPPLSFWNKFLIQ